MTTEIQQVEPVHLVALTGIHSVHEKIRYACEHTRPDPTPEVVAAWLARYGVTTDPASLHEVVDLWRREDQSRREPARAGNPVPVSPAPQPATSRQAPAGAKGFYLAAFLAMLVSVDTSWRFFGEVLHITDLRERVVMFAVLEVALIACGYGMRANVHRTGQPGVPRLIAWLLCGVAAYMAWQLSGFADGLARVALGPVLGLVMLDRALGIERRAGGHQTGTWARIGRELRERVLSRLGLSDDERDALARTRDRAARRVARLTLGGWVAFRSARVARALRASNVAHDEAARARMLAELAAIRHAQDLTNLEQPSPWYTGADPSHTAAHDTSHDTSQEASQEVRHDTSRVDPRPTPPTPARNRTPAAKTTRKPRTSAAGKGKGQARPTREEYLTRARVALADSEPVTVTAQWVQTAVPGISRSMSYVIADALSAQPSATATNASTDGDVDGVRGHAPDGSPDGFVDVAVDTDRPVSVNGGAR